LRFSTIALIAFGLAASPAHAFGPIVHPLVTSAAIDTLPSGLKPFYKTHRLEMPTLAVEATQPEEGPERRFAIDSLLPFPFEGVPKTEAAFKQRFGEQADIGRLPWLIEESYERLVNAYKVQDKEKILAESDLIASLVTDLHNPLALSANYDGQKTGQGGLWSRFSIKLPEAMQHRLKVSTDSARFLDDPRDYIFGIIRGTYVWLDNLVYAEDLARRGKSGYTELYFESLEARGANVLRSRLGEAATDVGSYWYTAWTQAGRPALK
jgi:hypothetical protein